MTINNTVGISIEIELGWAKHDKNSIDHLSNNRTVETKTLEKLLSACERNEVPISFNAVGHLLLEECNGSHGTRPDATSWFAMDPGTNRCDAPEFYARDLINMIDSSPIDHEICTHTFSHTVCGEATADIVDWELSRAKEAHNEIGIGWSSAMVPPRHSLPDLQIAAQHGIDTFRVPIPKRTFSMNRLEKLYYNLLSDHPIKKPEIVDGTCFTYSSPYLSLAAPYLPHGQLRPHPVFRGIPRMIRETWHKRYLREALDKVINNSGTAHFWSHLWDISNSTQQPLVESFIEQLGDEQDAGNIDIIRLADIRERVI